MPTDACFSSLTKGILVLFIFSKYLLSVNQPIEMKHVFIHIRATHIFVIYTKRDKLSVFKFS